MLISYCLTHSILNLVFFFQTRNPSEQPYFEQISVEAGLSQSTVNCLYQDRAGFLWVGTYIGLNRYDGYRFEVYRHEPGNANSLPGNQIRALCEDSQGRLWVGTNSGFCRFEGRGTNRFQIVRPNTQHHPELANISVNAMVNDANGNLWLGTMRGLYLYQSEQDHYQRFEFAPNQKVGLNHNWVTALLEDQQQNLWIGTHRGLTQLAPGRNHAQHWIQMPVDLRTRYHRETKAWLDRLAHQTAPLATAAGTQSNQVTTLGFTLKEEVEALVVNMGEATLNGWFDYGTITREGHSFWQPAEDPGQYAGGSPKNRITLTPITLPAGSYTLQYRTDEAHDPSSWNDLPPHNSQWWGIRIYPLPKGTVAHGVKNQLKTEELPAIGQVTNLITTASGNVLAGFVQNGLLRMGPNGTHEADDQGIRHWPPQETGVYSLRYVIEDRTGKLWLAGARGVSVFDPQTGSHQLLRHNPLRKGSLSANEVHTLLEDQTGVIWVGTVLNGLNKYSPTKPIFEHFSHNPYTKKSLHGDLVYAFSEDPHGIVWIGSRTGISAFHKNKRRFAAIEGNPPISTVLNGSMVTALHCDARGHLWIGSNRGIFEIQPELVTTEDNLVVRHGPVHHYSWRQLKGRFSRAVSFWEDTNGSLWIGTMGNGLLQTQIYQSPEARTFTRYYPNHQTPGSLPYPQVRGLLRDTAGDLWVGTTGAGISRLHENDQRFESFPFLPGQDGGLSHYSVTSILETPPGTLWIGTYGGGLNRMDIPTATFSWLTEQDGLPDNIVYGILQEDENHLWVSTNRGLARIAINGTNHSIRHYEMSDGLQSQEFNQGAYYKCADGTLLFGGIGGFNLFTPQRFPSERPPPQVYLSGFRVAGVQRLFSQPLHTLGEFHLNPGENIIDFQFRAMDYSNPKQNRFAYQLEGVDSTWVVSRSRQSLHYANLNAGDYRFRLRAISASGKWQSGERVVTVHIPPRLWETYWFRFLLFALLTSSAVFIYRWRLAQLRREHHRQEAFTRDLIRVQEQERGRIASELHDSLGQNLLVINNELQLQAQSSTANGIRGALGKLSELVQEAIEEVRQIAYNLRPHQLDRLGLSRAITSMTGRLSRSGDIAIQVSMDPVEDVLSKEAETQVFRVIQEGLHNAVKHAQASKISLKLKKHPHKLTVELRDDGVGFQFNGQRQHFAGMGLQTMANRAKLIGASFNLQSTVGTGTLLWLNIPIEERRHA